MRFNIYVVDDDQQVSASIDFMLGAADWPVRAFAEGLTFLDALDGLEPGCALIDIRMPRMDGIALLEQIAARRPGWPVVVMSGHADAGLAASAAKLGAVDFLVKPFRETTLHAALGKARQRLYA